ncbi:MAG: GNAT family N-acetyltransferase [Verrucomicrobia bacterium]|nr:GNAT family N-acetyltransferase [Verrucomicrobiota bacterium]
MEQPLSVSETIRIENENFFFPRSMELSLLKNCPEVIPVLAEWLYNEWHSYDTSLTKEKLVSAFQSRLNADVIPITFVVLKNSLPIGLISLKQEKDPEFRDFPKDSIWMGSLQVAPEERMQGIGEELLKFSQSVAKQFGCETLYFYTSNPTNVKWYCNRGAQIIEKRPFRDHEITVMQISLND